jgi:glucose-6-phosphate isomerase
MAALSIISQFLYAQKIQSHDFNQYFVFATDAHESELLELGNSLKIDCLEVPSDVGGRFCALTPVGYLPALFAGMNIDKLILGAKKAQVMCLENSSENNLLKACEFLFRLKNENNINQTVFMPYSSKLKYLAFWFTQLWAESLGKKVNLKNEVVHTGFTPITAYGATDQHSQMQLFMEGPHDKAIILIEVRNFEHDYKLNGILSSKNLDKLSSFSLADLMRAELHGTIKALKEANRPFIHIAIERNDEENLGQLIIFFESLTALMGDYLNIDPFNQPGVELGKIYAFEFLSLLK